MDFDDIETPQGQAAARARIDSGAQSHTGILSPWSDIALDFGVHSVQGKRKEMEDAHKAKLVLSQEVCKDEQMSFFGVYDGHAGKAAADYCRENLHRNLKSNPKLHTDGPTALLEAYALTEKNFLQLSSDQGVYDGTTAVTALVANRQLVVGNVGDSEAVLCTNGSAVLLTTPHNMKKSAEEEERVKSVGGRCFHHRLGHPKYNPELVSLAVSRAIGDAFFKLPKFTDGKESGLIGEPSISHRVLSNEDEFLILACDGLWDVSSYQEAVDFCRPALVLHSPTKVAEMLVDWALQRGSTDNITVMIVTMKFLADNPFEFDVAAQSNGAGNDAAMATSQASGDTERVPEAASQPHGDDRHAPTAINQASSGGDQHDPTATAQQPSTPVAEAIAGVDACPQAALQHGATL